MDKNLEKLKITIIQKLMSNQNKLLNKPLIIGYDLSEKKDHSSLIVGMKRGKEEFMIINEFYDDEADKIYKMLMGVNNFED